MASETLGRRPPPSAPETEFTPPIPVAAPLTIFAAVPVMLPAVWPLTLLKALSPRRPAPKPERASVMPDFLGGTFSAGWLAGPWMLF